MLAETIWVLGKPLRQSKPVLLALLDRLMTAANVEIESRDAVTAAVGSFAVGPGGFSDHLIGAVNRHAGCHTTLTFEGRRPRPELHAPRRLVQTRRMTS